MPKLRDHLERGDPKGSADFGNIVDDETPGFRQNRLTSHTYGLMSFLEFDGSYGRTHQTSLRHSVPSYDTCMRSRW